MLDIPANFALHGIDPLDLETLHSEALRSRVRAHQPRLHSAELEALGRGSIPRVSNLRNTVSRFWDEEFGPQFLNLWLSLASRANANPAFLREAQALSFLRDIHQEGGRPGLASGRTLRQGGGESSLQLPTFLPSMEGEWGHVHGHPITIPQRILSDVISHAAQKGIVIQPEGPFARHPSLRHVQFSADPTRGGADGILKVLKWLEQALPTSATLVPPDASVIPEAPYLRNAPRVRVADDPKKPRQKWLGRTDFMADRVPPLSELDASTFVDLEMDPSTSRPPDRSPVIQQRRELDFTVEGPRDTRGDELGELSRGDSVDPDARAAYKRAAFAYLEAYKASDPSIDLPDPSKHVIDPEQLESTASAVSQTARLRALTAKAKGKEYPLVAVSDSSPGATRAGFMAHGRRSFFEDLRQSRRAKAHPALLAVEQMAKAIAVTHGQAPPRIAESMAAGGEDASPTTKIRPERIVTTETRPTEWVETGPKHGIPPSEARFLRVLKPAGHTPRAKRKEPTIDAPSAPAEKLSSKPAQDGSHGSPMTDEEIRRLRLREAAKRGPRPQGKAADKTPSKPRVLSGHVIRGKLPKGPGGANSNRLATQASAIAKLLGRGPDVSDLERLAPFLDLVAKFKPFLGHGRIHR